MSKHNKSTPIEADPFTNRHGHVFNVGDAAIAVTCGRGNARLQHGKYIGIRYYPDYFSRKENPKGRPFVVMEVVKTIKKFVHKETGVEYDWKNEYKEIPYPSYPTYTADRAAHDAAYKVYQAEREEYGKKVVQRRKDYEYRDFSYMGRTMLQLNKIYPADIALRDVTL